MRIETAGSVITGKFGQLKNCELPDGTELKTEKGLRAIFSPHLQDNLSSVGRLCEKGYAVLFDKNGYQILHENFSVQGGVVHKQQRDKSGLYPLTIYFPETCRTPSFLSLSKKGGGNPSKIRNFFSVHIPWARGVVGGGREKHEKHCFSFHTLSTTQKRSRKRHFKRSSCKILHKRRNFSFSTVAWQNGPHRESGTQKVSNSRCDFSKRGLPVWTMQKRKNASHRPLPVKYRPMV